jgi:flagellar hook protein FlgE
MTGVFSAMRSGVTGLSAQAVKLGTISDNIANSNTIGYKRTDTQFSTLVNEQMSRSTYSAGGVRAAPRNEITRQGFIQSTSYSTDMAVNGRGFMVVSDVQDPDPQQDRYMLTRAGSFRPDDDGWLRNVSGGFLKGWRLNSDGTTVTTNPARDSFKDLESVNITGVNFTGARTTSIEFSANIPAQQSGAGASGTAITTPVEYYDPLGRPETMTLEWTPVVPVTGASNQWILNIYDSATLTPSTGLVGRALVSFNATGTTAGTIASVNTAAVPGATIAGAFGTITSPGTVAGFARAIPVAIANPSIAAGQVYQVAVGSNTYSYTAVGGDTQNTIATALAALVAADYAGTAAVGNSINIPAGANAGLLTINAAGRGAPAAGTGTYSTATGNFTITTPGGPIDVRIGTPNDFSGITQYSGDYVPTKISKDGAQFGAVSRIEIDEDGILRAVFDNGVTRPLYKIPVADVVNADSLIRFDANNFIVGKDAGAMYLWDSGKGPAGRTRGYALESSNVDISKELTDLIETQRTYSSNAKIITTSDEMLDEAVRLKR